MEPLVGLILCGGQSSRMGEDKSQISYHGMPQWNFIATMIRPFCSEIMLSCSPAQHEGLRRASAELPFPLTIVPDVPTYSGHGPVSGLLSAWETRPHASFLVVGCDYPLLSANTLTQLVTARNPNQDAVCFHRGGFDEPLVAIYEATSEAAIRKQLEDGKDSLRRVLKILSAGRLMPQDPRQLDSIDTLDQRKAIDLLNRHA